MDLDALLKPRSIAILGASERMSIGRSLIESLGSLGYDGRIMPVNPKYGEVLGVECFPSLLELPEPPDLVAFCVNTERIAENFELLPRCGARGAVIYDSGFAERGEEGRRLQASITAISLEAGIALGGPNCMGFLNPHHRSTSYMMPVRDLTRLAGTVGLVSQSGSICIGMHADVRRFGFSLIISSGNEAVLKTADYIDYLVDDPNTRIIATFTETVNEPERYLAALDRAAAAGKPVVVLKVGQSERARQAITTHTGGLAGEARVFSEALRRHRAIETHDLDEFTEVIAVLTADRLPSGRRLAVVTGSGGQAELILDVGSRVGLDLPPLPPAERSEIERVVGTLTGDGNPTDAWGNGDFATNLPHTLKVLRESDHNDAIVFCSDSHDDQPMGRPEQMTGYTKLLAESAAQCDRPHYQLNMRPGVMNTAQVAILRDAGLAMIGGTRQGLGAIDRVARHVLAVDRPRAAGRREGEDLMTIAGSSDRAALHEHDSKRALAAWGVRGPQERLARDRAAALAAAREIGFPVVLKAVSDSLPHKTELGLVHVDLADEAALSAAWDAMARRVADLPDPSAVAGFLVQEMVSGGVEVFAGLSRDPDFGLVLAFGLGGVAVETMRDFTLRLLPLQQGEAEAMIGEIRGAAMLGSLRGGPPADIAALARCLYALADFGVAEAERIQEVDLNPIKVLPAGKGCVAVDAFVALAKRDDQEKGGRHD